MTKVNFYSNVSDRQRFMLRLLKKALADQQPVLIFAEDETAARQLDTWLWSFDEISFVPHCLANDPLVADTPVQITWPGGAVPHQSILLNLAAAPAPIAGRFEKLLEIVSTDADDRAAGRERFRYYRERGYPLENFDMTGK